MPHDSHQRPEKKNNYKLTIAIWESGKLKNHEFIFETFAEAQEYSKGYKGHVKIYNHFDEVEFSEHREPSREDAEKEEKEHHHHYA